MVSARMAVTGCSVLDLYGGTGSLGFEALSRGAASVRYVDRNPALAREVAAAAAAFGWSDRLSVVVGRVEETLRAKRGEYDLILIDPPYRDRNLEFLGELLPPARLVVVESDSPRSLGSAWHLIASRRYGGTQIGLFDQGETRGEAVS